MKYPKPKALIEWEEQRKMIPQYCHNCDRYSAHSSWCMYYNVEVLEEITQSANDCPTWDGDIDIPF